MVSFLTVFVANAYGYKTTVQKISAAQSYS
jgi:hypothetical protein